MFVRIFLTHAACEDRHVWRIAMLILDGRALSRRPGTLNIQHVESAAADGDPDHHCARSPRRSPRRVLYLSDPLAWLWNIPEAAAIFRLPRRYWS